MTPSALDFLATSNGETDRPLRAGTWTVPGVIRLDGNVLAWKPIGVLSNGKVSELRSATPRPRDQLLPRFLGLIDAPADQILRFAQRFGVLQLCEHLEPACHGGQCEPAGGPFEYREPIVVWRDRARRMNALARAAVDLHAKRIRDAEAWRIVFGEFTRGRVPDDVDYARDVFIFVLGEWLRHANIGLGYSWLRTSPLLTLNPRGLFGALMLQLTTAIARCDGLSWCSGCALPYVPTRRPRHDQRAYCASCREDGIPQRHAKRDERERAAHRHADTKGNRKRTKTREGPGVR